MLKLYSMKGLLDIFPEDIRKDINPGALAKLVEQHGTYREVGKVRVMTESDVRHFLARIAVQQNAKPPEPAPSEVGYVTWIGDPAGSNQAHTVLVDWVPRGHELILLDAVRDLCDATAKVIATVDMSYGDFLKWKEAHRKPDHWDHGKWFYRTDSVMKLAQQEEERD